MKLLHLAGALFYVIIFYPFLTFADTPLPIYFFRIENQDRYIYPSDLESMNWREIRKRKEIYRTAREEIKKFRVHEIDFGLTGLFDSSPNKIHNTTGFSGKDFLTNANIFVCDPNGKTYSLETNINDKGPYISIPKDDNLKGRYLLGAYFTSCEHDIDMDGSPDKVHFSIKYLTSHYKNGGNVGSTSVVFFDDPDLMPLEIGPVINTAKSRYGGGSQTVHRTYEMMVKYNTKPLKASKVTVISVESGWSKSFETDGKGIIEVTPTDDRTGSKDFQNYLYIATYYDTDKNQYYVNTFPVTINKNQPEWRSKSAGFIYWAITGTAMILLTIVGYRIRKIRQQNRKLAIYEKQVLK